MKQILITLSVLLYASFSNAQDIITKNDSSKVRVEILEIYPSGLKYKLFDYPSGPLITESKAQIAYVTFKNGLTERFGKEIPANVVAPSVREARIKRREALYEHKNYIGFNYIAFLNTALGFHYMRDVKKAHLILDIPVAVGVGSPSITNGLYGMNYLDGMNTTRYERMNYQVGASAFFTPSMNTAVNFLMGPSFNFTEYRMSVASVWNGYGSSKGQRVEFNNSFRLYRAHYGVNVGLLARYSQHFNMSILLTLGFKQDSYSEADPYGFGIRKTLYDDAVQDENTKPYVNFAWTLGYRF